MMQKSTIVVNNDAVIEAMARVMADEAYCWGDRLHGWDDSGEDVRDSFRATASAALRAALAVKAKCPTCKGTGDVSPAEYVTEKWTCRDCGGSGEAPSLLDEAVELLRVERDEAVRLLLTMPNGGPFQDDAEWWEWFNRSTVFLARLRVEDTDKSSNREQ